MARTSKAEKIPTPETKAFTPHIGVTIEAKGKQELIEDAVLVKKEEEIIGVFDGMGGGMAGQEASSIAARTISRELSKVPEGADAKQWERAIGQSLEQAQEEVTKNGNRIFFEYLDDPFLAAAYRDKPQKEIEELMGEKDISPSGTTASVMKLVERPDGGADLVFGHTGDSRIYVLKNNGELKRLTKDQGLLEEAVRAGYYTQEEADFLDQATSKEEILEKFGKERADKMFFDYKHLRRGVTSALGISEAKFQTGIEHLKPGETAIGTSDGIHDNLTDEEIRQEMLKGGAPEKISARLVKLAGERSKEGTLRSKADDKAAAVIEIPETIEAVEAIEEPTLAPEQVTKIEDDLGKLREMAKYLKNLLTVAKTLERGLKPITSKKRVEEIMGLGGARGVEDTIFKTQSEILSAERTLAEHRGDIAAMQEKTRELRRLREEREKQLKDRDKETIERIKSRVA
jgi:serine/threonine protein phosphatase PrpC